MATKHPYWLAGLGLLAGACAADEQPDTLGQYTAEMQVAIDAMEAEVTAHHGSMQGLRELEAVNSFEWQHMQALAARMDRLERAQDGVWMCGQHMARFHHDEGMGPVMAQNEAMDGVLGEAYRELGRHGHAMDMAGALDLAIAEEGEHARIMDGLIGRLSECSEGMLAALDDMGEAGSLGCPAYTRVPAR